MDEFSTRYMDNDSPPKRFYAGEFRHSIDEKNRITVPLVGDGTGGRVYRVVRGDRSISARHVAEGVRANEFRGRNKSGRFRARSPDFFAPSAFTRAARERGPARASCFARRALPEDRTEG